MMVLSRVIGPLLFCLAVLGCGQSAEHDHGEDDHGAAEHGGAHEEIAKGPHGGRLLTDGDFSLELAIFETGVPPEFRAWAREGGNPVPPEAVDLTIVLTRLGGVEDRIRFKAQEDFLRGHMVVYEPHSFEVTVRAQHGSTSHSWHYDNFEGRTQIGPEIAAAFDLETEIAGPATLSETVTVYGRVMPDEERVRHIGARFPGSVSSVSVSLGDRVSKGQTLLTIESNESLNPYTIAAPIAGVVTERNVHPGEQAGDGSLLVLMDDSRVWVEFGVFPADLPRIRPGMPVEVKPGEGVDSRVSRIDYLGSVARADQSVVARTTLDNPDGALVPGAFVTGAVEVAEYDVPLAVKRIGLQSFRDFTVVYAQVGDQYEVRMLDLGRQDGEWVEVLGGLEPGARYVTENSYLIKADIEKSGASHDH